LVFEEGVMMAYVVVARWVAKEGSEEIVLDAIGKLTPASRAEPGCRLYQPTRNLSNPSEFLFFEIYADEAGYQAHVDSEHFQRYGFGQAIPALERREREFYETLE
jgi:quinol monooxygenase YgiN